MCVYTCVCIILVINIKWAYSSIMCPSFAVLDVPNRTSEKFKVIPVILMHITAVFKLEIYFDNKKIDFKLIFFQRAYFPMYRAEYHRGLQFFVNRTDQKSALCNNNNTVTATQTYCKAQWHV